MVRVEETRPRRERRQKYKNPTLNYRIQNREVLCAEGVSAMKTNCRLRETKRGLRTRQWLLHGADTREGGRAWRQTRDEKVFAREDGSTYIAALRSSDLRHTTKREGDISVTVVTSVCFFVLYNRHWFNKAPGPDPRGNRAGGYLSTLHH